MKKKKIHIVQRDDTLAFVADKYGLTLKELIKLNPALKNRVPYLGQCLKVE